MDVTGDGSKIQCCKTKQYCVGTWNVRSMNQGKLEVVKQEMAKVNIDILGISEVKWTGVGDLTQMTIISTTVGKNSLEKNEVALGINKIVQNTELRCNLKCNRMISVCFQSNQQYHSNPSLCPNQ